MTPKHGSSNHGRAMVDTWNEWVMVIPILDHGTYGDGLKQRER
jgi:hypothetical protein